MSLSKVLNAAAHGHIHETVGGSWNHYFGDEAGEETDNVLTFAHEIQASVLLICCGTSQSFGRGGGRCLYTAVHNRRLVLALL